MFFLIKLAYLIALLYSLLFPSVSGRFEAFSASYRYFGVPLLRERQGRTVISGVSVARGEYYSAGKSPPTSIPPGIQSRDMQFHVHSLNLQFLPQIFH